MNVARRYTQEERELIIAEYKKCGASAPVCKKFQIAKSTLFWFVKQDRKHNRPAGKQYSAKDIYKMELLIRQLKTENEILIASGLLNDVSTKEKIAVVERMKDNYSVHILCHTLKLAKGTYYNAMLRSPEKTFYQQADEELRPLIKLHFEASNERFGSPKIRLMLLREGRRVSEKHIARLMKEMGLVCKQSRLRCFNSTHRKFRFRINRVLKNFKPEHPNKIWVSDVSYVRVNKEFYAICVAIDLFSRKVLAKRISSNNDLALVLETMKDAFINRGEPVGLTFHSDQGVQYTAFEFRRYLFERNIQQSFSNPGSPLDNAVAESFFSIMKREELSHNYYHSEEELQKTVDDYVIFFNEMRPHRTLGNLSPDEYEAKYYARNKSKKATPDDDR